MNAESNWGSAHIHVLDKQRKTNDEDFPGFPDKETALVYLTHPMSGHFYLTSSKPWLGCWEIFHVPMEPNIGQVIDECYFQVFVDKGLITKGQKPYNILL